MGERENAAIVLDNGSGVIKAGFAGEDAPETAFPTVVGKAYSEKTVTSNQMENIYGRDALSTMSLNKIVYPIEHGVVKDWDDMEDIWEYMFSSKLCVNPREHPILISEAPLNPKDNREKMASVMFEKFGVPGVYVAVQAALSLYANGRISGVVLDSGDGVTHTVPIYEGFIISPAISRVNLGGRDLTNMLTNFLMESGDVFQSSFEKEIVRDIKEKLCYAAFDFQEESKNLNLLEEIYELPDGKSIKISDLRYRVPEVMFDPSLRGMEANGIHRTVFDTIFSCEQDVRRDLFHNIILAGGNTLFPGLPERLHKEISELAPSKASVKIIAPPERKYSVWLGGSILASLSNFQNMWVTRSEYEEIGSDVIHRKCF